MRSLSGGFCVEAYDIKSCFDIQPISHIVTEYRSQINTILYCRRLNETIFPESVESKVQHGFYTPKIFYMYQSYTNCLYVYEQKPV